MTEISTPWQFRGTDMTYGQSLLDSEVVIDLGDLPIAGLFFSSAEQARGQRSRVTLYYSQASGLYQLDRDIVPEMYAHYRSGRVSQHHLDYVHSMAQDIVNRFEPSVHVLEVGAGAGHLMTQLHALGFMNLAIVDPSPDCHKSDYWSAIQDTFPSKAVDEGGPFNLILAQHFLEHSPEPLQILRAMRNSLHDRGEIWIEVPDIEQSALADGGHHLSMIYSLHSGYFGAGSLTELARAAGLEVIDIQTVDHYGKSLVAKMRHGHSNAGTESVKPQPPAVTTEIRRYFSNLQTFGASLKPGLPCWGAAERCLNVLGSLVSGGFSPGLIFDSNPTLHGLYPADHSYPILDPNAIEQPLEEVVILSATHAQQIVLQNRSHFTTDALIHLPFRGSFPVNELIG